MGTKRRFKPIRQRWRTHGLRGSFITIKGGMSEVPWAWSEHSERWSRGDGQKQSHQEEVKA